MATYKILINNEIVMEGLSATSSKGAIDRYYDMKKGRVPKETLTAVEEK